MSSKLTPYGGALEPERPSKHIAYQRAEGSHELPPELLAELASAGITKGPEFSSIAYARLRRHREPEQVTGWWCSALRFVEIGAWADDSADCWRGRCAISDFGSPAEVLQVVWPRACSGSDSVAPLRQTRSTEDPLDVFPAGMVGPVRGGASYAVKWWHKEIHELVAAYRLTEGDVVVFDARRSAPSEDELAGLPWTIRLLRAEKARSQTERIGAGENSATTYRPHPARVSTGRTSRPGS